MVMTEWFELRSGFITNDVIKWREFIWAAPGPDGRRQKQYTGEGFGGQRRVRVGERVISAEVIQGPDEDGWVYLLLMQYDNLGAAPADKILMPLPIGKQIKRKYKTIMNGEPQRQRWEDESARARLVREAWDDREHKKWMSVEMDEDED